MQVLQLLEGATSPSALLNELPMLLDPTVLSALLAEMQRLFGSSCQPLRLLASNPGLAWSCQSLASQSRGDRDAEYYGNIFVQRPDNS